MGWTLPSSARGVWVKIPAVEAVEVLAAAGVDFVVIDREHGAIDLRSMVAMIAVCRGLGMPVFVRVAGHSPQEVLPALDAGATGLFIPQVDDARLAQDAVDACRFPPIGHRRGSPTTRAGSWGATGLSELVRRGNEDVVLVAQVETPQAVQAIEGIVATEGVDAVLIGPFDLALSSGLAADSAAFGDLVARAEKAVTGRLALGGAAPDAVAAANLAARGYSFAMVGVDTSLLAAAAGALMDRGAA